MNGRSGKPGAFELPARDARRARRGADRRVGETLFEIGDQTYPFIAILEGEVAVLDPAGDEIVRHGASGFLGEMNLLSGQTVFLTAVATEPMRYIAVERDVLRRLLFEDGSLSDLLLSAFVERRELLQQREGIGIEIVGPRESRARRAGSLDFARRMRLPYSWLDPEENDGRGGADRGARRRTRSRSSGFPAAPSCGGRPTASSRARSGSASSWRRARRSTCWSSAAGRPASAPPSTAPRRASTRW